MQIIWEPYSNEIIQLLPAYCLQGRDIWRSVVPLICIHIVEWHYPNRVLRQFGFAQPIPDAPYQLDALHAIDLRDQDADCIVKHARWVDLWARHAHCVVGGIASHRTRHYHSQYLEWYRSVTHRWISPTSARLGVAVCTYSYQSLIILNYLLLLPNNFF